MSCVHMYSKKDIKGTGNQINGKYMISSTQITRTEIFAFIAVSVFKLAIEPQSFVYKQKRQ